MAKIKKVSTCILKQWGAQGRCSTSNIFCGWNFLELCFEVEQEFPSEGKNNESIKFDFKLSGVLQIVNEIFNKVTIKRKIVACFKIW